MLIIKNYDLRRTPASAMPCVTYGNTEDRLELRFMCDKYFVRVSRRFAELHTVAIMEPGQYAEFNAELVRSNQNKTTMDVAKDDITTSVLISVVADKAIKFVSNKGKNLFYLFDIKDRKHMFLGFQFEKGATYPDINIVVESESETEITLRLSGPGANSKRELVIPYNGNASAQPKMDSEDASLAEYQKVLSKFDEPKPAYEKKAVKVDNRPKAVVVADHAVKESEATKSKTHNVTKVIRAKRSMTMEEIMAFAQSVAKSDTDVVLHHSVTIATGIAIASVVQSAGQQVFVAVGKGYEQMQKFQ